MALARKEIFPRLKRISTARPVPEDARFPDFLIAGPHRTGTTWLYRNLAVHPEILLPASKEIFYFSVLGNRKHPLHRSDELAWYLGFFRESRARRLIKNLVCRRRFGEGYRPRICGEATAAYALLEPEVIREIVLLNPGLKVAVMVRHPVERAWSHAKMQLMRVKKRRFERVPAAEFERCLASSWLLECGFYSRIMERWSSALPAENLFAGRFESIRRDPGGLLLGIMRFLGVSDDPKYLGPLTLKKFSGTDPVPIPGPWEERLFNYYADEMRRLEDRYGWTWPRPCVNPAPAGAGAKALL